MCRIVEEMVNESYREAYEEAYQEAYQEGCEKGRRKVRKAVALRMLEKGKYTLEDIIEISQLSLDEVKRLQAGQEI